MLAGILCTATAVVIALISPPAVDDSVEGLLLDYRFQVRALVNPPRTSADIMIVAIDDDTLARYGRWPLPRSIQARIITRILAGRPRALGIDIFYAERQNDIEDQPLIRAVRGGSGRVVLAVGFDRVSGSPAPDYLWDAAITRIKHAGDIVDALVAGSVRIGLDRLYDGAVTGHVWSPADRDGKLRREYLFLRYDGDYYPSFGLVMASVVLGGGPGSIVIHGGRGVEVAGRFIPMDPAGRFRINYPGPDGSYKYISAADILEPDFDPVRFRGRIVLFGASALHTYDQVVTPLSARMPGVEKNAAVIDNIVNHRFIRDLPLFLSLLVILTSGLLLTLVLVRRRATTGIAASVGMVTAVVGGNCALFAFGDFYTNLFYPLVNILVISVFAIAYRYRHEEQKARDIRRIFASYVSPKIVERLVANPEEAKLGGVRREVTVLFSDVRGFTALSEKNEPEEVVAMLNEYFTAMTEVIFRWDGTLDKFVGDEILAFWGAPLAQHDHAERALRCAIEMSDCLDRLREKWRVEGRLELDCGIGLNSGEVLVGNIGAQGRKMDYTVIGDQVNLGARVEALTRSMDCRILLTEFTLAKIEQLVGRGMIGHVEFSEGEPVTVKGKEIPVMVYKLIPRPHAVHA